MKHKIKLNLMGKLLIYFLILIIAPVLVLGVFSYNAAKVSLKNEAENTLKVVLDNAVNEVEIKLEEIEERMELVNNLYNVALYAEQGSKEKTYEKAEKILKEFERTLSDMTEMIAVADINGNIILDSKGGSELSVNISDRQYFKESIEGKKTWSEVLKSKITGEPVIAYSIPLKGSSGNVCGAVFIITKFSFITDMLSKVEVGEQGYVFMLDENGTILYHPDTSKILQEDVHKVDKDNEVLYENEKKMMNKEEGKVVYTYAGIDKLMIYKPVGQWSIAINIPVKEYMWQAVNIKNTTIMIALIAVLVGICVAIFAAKGITKPVKELMNLMGRAEKGDLTVLAKVKSKDEIGQLSKSFNAMLDGQTNAMKKVLDTSNIITQSADESSGASQEMAASAENQSASAEELTTAINEMSKSILEVTNNITDVSKNINNVTNSMEEMNRSSQEMAKTVEDTSATINGVTNSMEEINVSTKTIAESSLKASEEAERTVRITENGKEIVDNTVIEMDEINTAVSNLTIVISGLGNTAEQIGDIVEVIDDIAEQTNLLALNASIEAARAGEHGKGFAVVAGAIGNLAEKCGEATKDIAKLIKRIQGEVQNAVDSTEKGVNQVQNGVDSVKNMGNAFDNIFKAIKNTTLLINEIAALTEEQSKTSINIMRGIEKVNKLSMEASAVVEEQTASVGEVFEEVERINSLTQQIAAASEEQFSGSKEVLCTAENVSEMALQVSTCSEEVAVTSHSLLEESNKLMQLVSTFKLN
jgi:methyl-accepting chemotaxis protein